MTDDADLWETRAVTGNPALQICGEGLPALVIVQGENRVRMELRHPGWNWLR
jgi:hypothetical protein